APSLFSPLVGFPAFAGVVVDPAAAGLTGDTLSVFGDGGVFGLRSQPAASASAIAKQSVQSLISGLRSCPWGEQSRGPRGVYHRPMPVIPTTVVGSYPQPDWLIDRAKLGSKVPRVRAPEIWRVAAEYLEQA